MVLLYLLIAYVHVLFVAIWFGVVFINQFFIIPSLKPELYEQNAMAYRGYASRMGKLMPAVTGLVIIVGLIRAFMLNYLNLTHLLETSGGNLLILKIILIIISGSFGPKLGKMTENYLFDKDITDRSNVYKKIKTLNLLDFIILCGVLFLAVAMTHAPNFLRF